MNTETQSLRTIATPLVERFIQDQTEVLITNISTEDGFVICQRSSDQCNVEADKMAATISALTSMAEASAKSIKKGELEMVIIESNGANILVKKTMIAGLDVILSIAINHKIAIGKAIYITNRLSEELKLQ